MGWTLLAFHSIYVNSGIEYPLSFIVPFYYYFKLLLLGATFALPSIVSLNPLKNWSSENSGSNPMIVCWFHYLIVPGVHRMHEFMDHDPKRWMIEQISILPFLLLDYFILPGVLLSDEDKERVRLKVNGQDGEVNGTEIEDVPAPSAPPASLFQRDDIFPIKTNHVDLIENVSEDNDSISRSDVVLDPISCQRNQVSYEYNLNQSPTRQNTKTILKTPERPTTSLFPRTTPTGFTANLYINSPVAKSRVASSTLRLRRFSREHEPAVTLTPRLKDLASKYEGLNKSTGKKKKDSSPELEQRKQRLRYSPSSNENISPNKNIDTARPERSRRERLSLGDHFRELVTGDANIRVRDHLFDLDLPSVPICPSPRNVSPPSYSYYSNRIDHERKRAEIDTSNITTRSRRSSRLANDSYPRH